METTIKRATLAEAIGRAGLFAKPLSGPSMVLLSTGPDGFTVRAQGVAGELVAAYQGPGEVGSALVDQPRLAAILKALTGATVRLSAMPGHRRHSAGGGTQFTIPGVDPES